jgi:hypothetical protein
MATSGEEAQGSSVQFKGGVVAGGWKIQNIPTLSYTFYSGSTKGTHPRKVLFSGLEWWAYLVQNIFTNKNNFNTK